MPRKSNHYVNNKRLYAEMKEFIYACREAEKKGELRPDIPKYVGESILHIATNMARKLNFAAYTYKEEMIGDGIETCIKYIHNFNPDKYNNPFAYFSQFVHNAFIQRIKHEKKLVYARHKILVNSMVMNDLVNMPDDEAKQFESHVSGYLDDDKVRDIEAGLERERLERLRRKKEKERKGIDKFIEGDE